MILIIRAVMIGSNTQVFIMKMKVSTKVIFAFYNDIMASYFYPFLIKPFSELTHYEKITFKLKNIQKKRTDNIFCFD